MGGVARKVTIGDDGNRATTALVYRAVDDLGKTMDAHFGAVNARLDMLSPLPARVDGLERTMVNHEARLISGEREREDLQRRSEAEIDQRSKFRMYLPSLIVSVVSLGVATLSYLSS